MIESDDIDDITVRNIVDAYGDPTFDYHMVSESVRGWGGDVIERMSELASTDYTVSQVVEITRDSDSVDEVVTADEVRDFLDGLERIGVASTKEKPKPAGENNSVEYSVSSITSSRPQSMEVEELVGKFNRAEKYLDRQFKGSTGAGHTYYPEEP